MTLLHLLLIIVVIVALGWLAHWLITSFFPEPVRMPALLVVGLLLLLAVLTLLFPSVLGVKVF